MGSLVQIREFKQQRIGFNIFKNSKHAVGPEVNIVSLHRSKVYPRFFHGKQGPVARNNQGSLELPEIVCPSKTAVEFSLVDKHGGCLGLCNTKHGYTANQNIYSHGNLF